MELRKKETPFLSLGKNVVLCLIFLQKKWNMVCKLIILIYGACLQKKRQSKVIMYEYNPSLS